MLSDEKSPGPARCRWQVRGQVQGVGYRPFAYRLARRLGLTGCIRNDREGVTIEAQGPREVLTQFARALTEQRPALATVGSLVEQAIAIVECESDFRILDSTSTPDPVCGSQAEVTVDTAVCPDCLAEMRDPADRRYGHALSNCTNCGPRYSIIRRVPYDRPNTTMAGFAMCDSCAAEYGDPGDRRFHAQPTACPRCGPTVALWDTHGRPLPGDPIRAAAERLAQGQIVAVKGVGGFHLAVRGDRQEAVARLRRLKGRDAKPLALMGRDLEAVRRLVALSLAAERALQSPAAPILLAPRRSDAPVADAVAPGNHRLGVMLPYTPIHHLLFAALPASLTALVMTSGNRSDEPLAIDNAEALERLGPLCDALLVHTRPIERCVDDSILLDLGDARSDVSPLPLRRARGYVPAALSLPCAADEDGLCVGGELKNTVAVVCHGQAVLSQPLGDLKHPLALRAFERAIDDLFALLGVRPKWIAHDLHPAYLSTRHAGVLARRWGVPLLAVQHHHAHAAAVMAEYGETGPVLAVVCDGAGYGPDGTSWGGELLRADLMNFTRLARLQTLRLPGGDAAARDTRRCGLALLYQAFGAELPRHPATLRLVPDPAERQMLCAMIDQNVRCTRSSGAGRVFDGVAALLGLCAHNSFEAQAALALESAAAAMPLDTSDAGRPLFEMGGGDGGAGLREIALDPLYRFLVAAMERGDAHAGELAALFHSQLARAWDVAVAQAMQTTGLNTVVLSGGVFCNQRLTAELTARLERRGGRVLRHRLVPPGDGGLALGQAAVAAARGNARAGAPPATCTLAAEKGS
jgi:hydrogenase maturation protein HypF